MATTAVPRWIARTPRCNRLTPTGAAGVFVLGRWRTTDLERGRTQDEIAAT